LGIVEGVSAGIEVGIFATFGASSLKPIEGPNHIVSADLKAIAGVGPKGSVTASYSVDETTRSLAVDPNSGLYVGTYGISAGGGIGGKLEAALAVSPAYLPNNPIPLNNTYRLFYEP
jgi:6-phosphogluconate dehydrogenase (decarboxylating)